MDVGIPASIRKCASAIEVPPMKELPLHDRPREKLARAGPSALGDNELLAIVIGHGTRRRDALALATDVLTLIGGLRGLARSALPDLQRATSLGPARASRVLAAIELGRRTLLRGREDRPRFLGPREIAAYLIPQFGDRTVEHFGVVLLDAKRRLLRTAILSVGTLDASVAHPREIFREATVGGAAAIVVFHNHPSGDPTPSPEDVDLTRRLVEAGVIVGIDVLDHLILAETRYFSFKEAQRL
jgi:DNA repair protein RadC